ncbi:DUF134 domain-containing protein [Clostridium sp. 19966]|uniref:DUF134 domain-containing protein n=1 Tax=Clostridium sp. 19966 TaxID=2768166 RepID=UPI0028DEF7DD|nr:DUF134 domain-containing protein [Clostridium sp. 19966]MDT8715647.1 DUF134 domain-containing protein [Clostridium sp. 19966]
MPRPTKYRKVECFPCEACFGPYEKEKEGLEEIELKIEELEAMRLKDIAEFSQEQCAEKMDVSRQTFQNIIDSARKKVAIALTEGKIINIRGGNYLPKQCIYLCKVCGETYQPSTEFDISNCPKCGSQMVMCCSTEKECKRWCQCHEIKLK